MPAMRPHKTGLERKRWLRKFLPCLVDGLVLILVSGRVIGCLGTADALNAIKEKKKNILLMDS